ncbi:MAG: FAD-binding protein [Novosphingobium sp.]
MDSVHWDEECDIVVAGSGGGLAGAYIAGTAGQHTIVLESTDKFGGMTCYSGGGFWMPGNHVNARAGLDDSNERALEYFQMIVGNPDDVDRQRAFVRTGPSLVAELEKSEHLPFTWVPFPDYYADRGPPAHSIGRDIFPLPLPIEELGDLSDKLRLSMAADITGEPEPEPLSGGRALVARLLLAVRSTGHAELRLNSALQDVVFEDGRVTGVVVSTSKGERRILARRGVLIATGGFERNQAMRDEFGVPGDAGLTAGAPGAQGGGIRAGVAAGGDIGLMDECWWMPGVIQPSGRSGFIAALNGGVMVNIGGERFANESMPYDRFGRELVKQEPKPGTNIRAWWIWDGRFGETLPAVYNPMPILPFAEYEAAGLWHKADTLAELAAKIGAPPETLTATIERFNGFAASGVDADHHRGEAPYDRYLATEMPKLFGMQDATPVGSPNPSLFPVTEGPFYAAALGLGDLGTKGGLRTDADARVLRADGSVIEGLYAAGDAMASVTGHHYPAPGSPIGTCMVFSYRAVMNMMGRSDEIAFDTPLLTAPLTAAA